MFEIFDNAADNTGQHSSLSRLSSQTEQTQKKGFGQRGVQGHKGNFDRTHVELGEAQIGMREPLFLLFFCPLVFAVLYVTLCPLSINS